MAKFYITTPIYYANARPHIGSAYTTIAADVLARFHRQQGDDVLLLTGTAEHGTKIAQAAADAGKTPQEFVDENAAYFEETWNTLHIQFDDFIRTTEKRHTEGVQAFFEKLKESGKIYEGEYEGLYCVGHEAFLKEDELDENGMCPDHNTKPERLKEKNWFFKLSDYTQEIKAKIENGELVVEPASARNKILSIIEEGLKDISISRQNVEWALPLPWDQQAQTIYVWLDELFNYCSAIGYGLPPDKGGEGGFNYWWPADIHVMGKDIIKFHCIIWPALLMAIGEKLPRKVFANGYLTVDDRKIGKSLGNAVDPNQLVEEYGADAVRYFLLREVPFGSDGNFSHDRLRERYNSDLANGLGNLVSRTLNMIEQFAPNVIPAPEPESTVSLPDQIRQNLDEVASHISNLAFDKALGNIWQAVAWADQRIEETKPWQLAKDESKQDELNRILQELYEVLVQVNDAIAPFMPDAHETLSALLAARPLKKPAKPLFERK